MATVRVSFNGGNVPIVTGDVPPDERTPILNPTPTGFTTNQTFMVREGIYCFGLDAPVPHAPLWQVVRAIDDEPAEIVFRKQL